VSEGAALTAVARIRAGDGPDVATVRVALAEVPDPEIPVVSIVDLGMVEDVEAGADAIRVELLPTFVGCPALDAIREAVERRLRVFGRPVEVRFGYRVPWTSDRITAEGHSRLRAAGLAPPGPKQPDAPLLVQLAAPVPCPHCGSRRTVLENAFGPTQCRAIYHCTACRQPFEAFKAV
jgi:ring-1,2-phenylacetyl-CoA epoxidase subunit PaaD